MYPLPPYARNSRPLTVPPSGGQSPSSDDANPSSGHDIPLSDHGIPSSDHGIPSSGHGIPSSDHGIPSSDHGIPSSGYANPSSGYANPSSGHGFPSSESSNPFSDFINPSRFCRFLRRISPLLNREEPVYPHLAQKHRSATAVNQPRPRNESGDSTHPTSVFSTAAPPATVAPMPPKAKPTKDTSTANLGFEQKLWLTADSRGEAETAEGNRSNPTLSAA